MKLSQVKLRPQNNIIEPVTTETGDERGITGVVVEEEGVMKGMEREGEEERKKPVDETGEQAQIT